MPLNPHHRTPKRTPTKGLTVEQRIQQAVQLVQAADAAAELVAIAAAVAAQLAADTLACNARVASAVADQLATDTAACAVSTAAAVAAALAGTLARPLSGFYLPDASANPTVSLYAGSLPGIGSAVDFSPGTADRYALIVAGAGFSGSATLTVTVEGSNDGVTWTILSSESCNNFNPTVAMVVSAASQYLRVECSDGSTFLSNAIRIDAVLGVQP